MKIVLGMPFLTLSNVDIQFAGGELTWRSYSIAEALPTTSRVEFIDKKEFAKAMLDKNVEVFVVHIALSQSRVKDDDPSDLTRINVCAIGNAT